MKELKLTITADEPPPSEASIEGVKTSLEETRQLLSSICTSSACIALLGFFALEIKGIGTLTGQLSAKIFYAVGLTAFLAARQYQSVIARRIAEVSPIDDTLLPEAATLANASPLAREYVTHLLRVQKRPLILAELRALRALAAQTPREVARESLYGR